jgi:DNA-binding GntR family transcriptional regulator
MFSQKRVGGATKLVYDYLYEEIVNNRLTPGSPLSELELANTLNTSRSPVREALMMLEGMGLVRRFPNRGCIVSPITAHDVDEIFALRVLLESFALKESCQRIDETSLRDLLRDFEAIAPDSGPEAYFETDRRLHDIIVGSCGNSRLTQILHTINGQIEQFRRISSIQPKRLIQSRLEHIDIVRALIDKDLEKSCRLLEEHIGNVKSSTLNTYISLEIGD